MCNHEDKPIDKFITVKGAREHNLNNVNISIPKNQLTVITGLSGSGKSSLAFDTIYAEGQRRYVESLSAYARQFLEMQNKPDVDYISGLSPAISIEQKTTSKNPRSTVGTVTEIYDYMRLLWSRVGTPYSPVTGEPISSQSITQMVDRVCEMKKGSKLLVLSPIIRGRKGEYRKEIEELQAKGFQRLKVDNELYLIEEVPPLEKNKKHDILVVVDRIILKDDIQTRLADSIETAVNLSDGLLIIEDLQTKETTLFSQKFADPVSGFTIEEIEPRLFSFNNPAGACDTCKGLGKELRFDPDLVIPNKSLSLSKGAIAPWNRVLSKIYKGIVTSVCTHFDQEITTPWKDLTKELQEALLYGTKQKIKLKYRVAGRNIVDVKKFEGVINNIKRRFTETESAGVREELAKFQTAIPCDSCKGKRLKLEALCVKIGMKDISEVTEYSIGHAHKWFSEIESSLSPKEQEIAKRILKEIKERLGFLVSVGLNYLTLNRSSGTLSGGESQRIRLASQIGSGLTGVLYVLDEPSIGLHQRDNDRLLESLGNLKRLGNTVVVVEHDEDAIRTADYLIDMGPRAGVHGGYVVAEGTPAEVMKNGKSITADYLTGKRKIDIPKERRKGNGKKITVVGARANNLKDITVNFPLGQFVCVTGVSGGGKSSLVLETLWKGIEKHFNNNPRLKVGEHNTIKGMDNIDKVIDIDQSPIGRTPRSNPATYTALFTPVREWFAQLPEAKARGYKPGRFSFNVKGGRCETCSGDGLLKIEMHFLPDVYVECDQCKGKRYNRETLEVKFKDKSISDVLHMTVDEALEFFANTPKIKKILQTLQDVGLGYIQLGQSATTMSGGEAQRIKLAKELSKRNTGKTLYILDEPTTGLHFEDIRQLLGVLDRLVEGGNSIIVIEHNLDVIKIADHIIDIGPEGGSGGGDVVTTGTPEEIIKCKRSYTAKYLKPVLDNK